MPISVPKHMLQADLQDPSVPGAALSSSHSGSFPKLLQLMGLSPAVSHSCTTLPFHYCAFLCSLFLSSSLAPSPPQLGPTATMAGPIFWPCLVYYFLSLLWTLPEVSRCSLPQIYNKDHLLKPYLGGAMSSIYTKSMQWLQYWRTKKNGSTFLCCPFVHHALPPGEPAWIASKPSKLGSLQPHSVPVLMTLCGLDAGSTDLGSDSKCKTASILHLSMKDCENQGVFGGEGHFQCL